MRSDIGDKDAHGRGFLPTNSCLDVAPQPTAYEASLPRLSRTDLWLYFVETIIGKDGTCKKELGNMVVD